MSRVYGEGIFIQRKKKEGRSPASHYPLMIKCVFAAKETAVKMIRSIPFMRLKHQVPEEK
jgi:hypothetical protein